MIGSSIFPPPWDDTYTNKVAANERRGRDIFNVVFVLAGIILSPFGAADAFNVSLLLFILCSLLTKNTMMYTSTHTLHNVL